VEDRAGRDEVREALKSSEILRGIVDQVNDGVYVLDRDRRIVYWNAGAERISGYPAEEVVGKHCYDNILIHVDESARPLCDTACPVVEAMKTDRVCEADLYLHHRDGHRVPIHVRVSPLKSAAGEIVGGIEVFRDNTSEAASREKIEELERLSLLDELTGLGNRRHGEVHLAARMAEYERYGWPFGLLYFDIDHFKKVNDTYGHESGDRVLKMVAATTENSIRSLDIVSRWGGEEFTAIIENVDEETLGGIADKLRGLVEQSNIVHNKEVIRVTVSVGGTMVKPDDSAQSLVGRADRLMYESKENGRNMVTLG
jgi:diguanylate cyclase (GGDEF)-like protein/PAS domain S-box-containing protein